MKFTNIRFSSMRRRIWICNFGSDCIFDEMFWGRMKSKHPAITTTKEEKKTEPKQKIKRNKIKKNISFLFDWFLVPMNFQRAVCVFFGRCCCCCFSTCTRNEVFVTNKNQLVWLRNCHRNPILIGFRLASRFKVCLWLCQCLRHI